ncbi:RecT family recombinase [Paraburkholderia sp. MM6662-R1]|uniref:RecT family recombinase n=1 Tax=Paraburkholderia sp. MM6662-R1 TaxID=2991066 RepID=UPI003D1BEA67
MIATVEEEPRTLKRFELNPDMLGYIERFSNLMATAGVTVPEPYRGKPGNCAAVTIQALQWGMNPFAVAAKTHFVNNQIGYEAQLIIAAVNTSGLLVDRINWDWFGDWEKIVGQFVERESKTKKNEHGEPVRYRVPAWNIEDEAGVGVRCFATLRGEREPRVLTILMKQARVRNSTLWADDPKQQIAYLSGKRWSRLHASEIVFGVRTPDELDVIDNGMRDMGPAEEVRRESAAHGSSRTSSVKERMKKNATTRNGAPTLDEVLKAIAEATNSGEMTAAGELATKLRTDQEKEIARTAYSDKLNAERAAAHAQPAQDDPADAGSKRDRGGEVAAMTFAQVMEALEQAETLDALDVAADLIRTVPDEGQREELEEFYLAKRHRMESEQ